MMLSLKSLLIYSRCPKPVQISGFETGSGSLTYTHRRLLTHKLIFNSACYFTKPDYLHTNLFIPIYQTAVWIISPVEFCKEACSFQCKLRLYHDLSSARNCLYLSGAMLCILFILRSKPSSCNGRKCKIGFRTYILYLHFITELCSVPFCINMSCDRTHMGYLFCLT